MTEDAGIQQLFPNLHGLVPGLSLPLADQPIHELPPNERLLVHGQVILAVLDQVRAVSSRSERREGEGRGRGRGEGEGGCK